MDKKTIIKMVTGAVVIAGIKLLFPKPGIKNNLKVDKIIEEFDGIPLSELSELAKECYHGIKCSIDKNGFLLLHYTSKSGKTKYQVQMMLDKAGKLIHNGCYYSGQCSSSADQFVELFNKKYNR